MNRGNAGVKAEEVSGQLWHRIRQGFAATEQRTKASGFEVRPVTL